MNNGKTIYTHNRAADIVEVFKDLLDKHNIQIPDEARKDDESEGCLYGMTYSDLLERVENRLVMLLDDAGVENYISDISE